MATYRAYYGQDRDREYFERIFQSANINFIIGSGASLPAISVLGDIESELEALVRAGNDDEYFSKSESFLDNVWKANNVLLKRSRPAEVILPTLIDDVVSTQNNYAKLMRALEMLLTRRRTGLLPQRINLFTTNYDLFIEDAAVKNNNVILNDGFRQRADIYNRTVFDAKCFYQTIHATGNLYNYSVELPTVNLIKLHGSLSWHSYDKEIYYSIKDMKPVAFNTPKEKQGWVMSHQLVLPRKDKFRETLLENVYYDLLRTYSNELDKEGSLLIVFGFSFADEHIETLTKKALRNATLKIVIFAYNEAAKDLFLGKFRDYSNVDVVFTPGAPLDFKKMNEIITSFLGGMK
ncbi:SIR2 family protein [Klebsiella pneumoniae]